MRAAILLTGAACVAALRLPERAVRGVRTGLAAKDFGFLDATGLPVAPKVEGPVFDGAIATLVIPTTSSLRFGATGIGKRTAVGSCVVDGRAPLAAACKEDGSGGADCDCSVGPLPPGHHAVAAYVADGTAAVAAAMAVVRVPASPEAVAAGRAWRAQSGSFRVGAYYTHYMTLAAQAMQNVSLATGRPSLVVEDVLRSENATLADVWTPFAQNPGVVWPYFASTLNHSFYQHMPQLGPYCLYKRRPGEAGIVPDCPGINETLAKHAAWMTMAGIDFAVQDGTNWGAWPSPPSDIVQLRPMEVMMQGWADLRASGTRTPDLAVWNCINGNFSLWQQYLDRVVNPPEYADLQLRGPDGKKVFFVVNADRVPKPIDFHWPPPKGPLAINETSVRALAANGGRHDIHVQFAWLGKAEPAWWGRAPSWSFLGHCEDEDVRPGDACGNNATQGTSLGTVWTVDANDALDSMPFGCAGKRRGLQMKKLFSSLFGQPADFIFLPSFNEYPVDMHWPNPWGETNPLMSVSGGKLADPFRRSMFIDGWGSERSRTLEPSETDGGFYLSLVASCLRVARLAADPRTRASAVDPSGDLPCTVAGEECCQFGPREYLVSVWSFASSSGGRAALLGEESEVATLSAPGAGWRQVCSPFGTYARFCTNESVWWQEPYFEAVTGPFLLLSNATQPSDVPYPSVRIVRCSSSQSAPLASRSFSFATSEAGCAAAGMRADYVLGVGAADRSAGSELPRALRKCIAAGATEATGGAYHTIDAACKQGDTDDGVLAFVF